MIYDDDISIVEWMEANPDKKRIKELEAEVERLKRGLEMLAEGNTPWMATEVLSLESWQILSKHARQLLEGEG